MLTNTLDLKLGFTRTLTDRAAVEREAHELSAFHGQPVAVWREGREYTGFVLEAPLAEEMGAMLENNPCEDTELVAVVQAN